METLDFANPELYTGICVAVKRLFKYPVSTFVGKRSFNSMRRLKTPLRSAMSDVQLKEIDSVILVINDVISEFSGKKDRLALCL